MCPEGQGLSLTLYSWGWKGQIRDLARVPRIIEQALPWLRIDRRRIYAVGSMGGQETLLLVALSPEFLAGAAALDSDTNMAVRYRDFPELRGGATLQQLARVEIGGTPATAPKAYARRSPFDWARAIAFSGVPRHSSNDSLYRAEMPPTKAPFSPSSPPKGHPLRTNRYQRALVTASQLLAL